MDFQVVDIPVGPTTKTTPIIEAMIANVGKAINVPTPGKNSNTLRKSLRMALSNRGLLEKYNFRSRIASDDQSITLWLEEKTPVKKEGM